MAGDGDPSDQDVHLVAVIARVGPHDQGRDEPDQALEEPDQAGSDDRDVERGKHALDRPR